MEQFKIKSGIFGKKSGVVNNAVIEKGSGSYKQFLGHYSGEVKDGLLNGQGTLTMEWEKKELSGNWKDGRLHGFGKYKYQKSIDEIITYEGEWKEGEKHGKGIMKYSNGDTYKGEWEKGEKHGKGIMKYSNGDTYEGEWEKGEEHGKGIMKYSNGGTYEGEWEKGEIHGRGTYKFSSGSIYEGEYKQGKRNGNGRFKSYEGEEYEGGWKDGKRNGKGVEKNNLGDVYEGEWEEDERHGKGILKYCFGAVYDGEFKNGAKHGEGIYKDDFEYYKGEYLNGKKHGMGLEKIFSGDGVLISLYEGMWFNGHKFGIGNFNDKENNISLEGEWIEDIHMQSMLNAFLKDENINDALKFIDDIELKSYVAIYECTVFTDDTTKVMDLGLDNVDFRKKLWELFDKEYFANLRKPLLENKELFQKKRIINLIETAFPSYSSLNWRETNDGGIEKRIDSIGDDVHFFNNQPRAAIHDFNTDVTEKLRLPDIIKIGMLSHKAIPGYIPAYIPFSDANGIAITYENSDDKERSLRMIEVLIFRLLLSIPPGQSKLHIIDPEKNGSSFSSLFGLDNKILNPEIWDDDIEIREGINKIKNMVPEILRTYLKDKYESLAEYNNKVKHSIQPFTFILIADFPRGFDSESAKQLLNLMNNGYKAGVYVLMSIDKEYKSDDGINIKPFSELPVLIDLSRRRIIHNTMADEVFNDKFTIESFYHKLPSDIQTLKDLLNEQVNERKTVNVEMETNRENIWKQSAGEGIRIPIGLTPSMEKIFLTFGLNTDVHHALIGGATGSGKSVLLHEIIINGAFQYSPAQLKYILLDYKEGTEFVIYRDLPHIKVLSVESEKEFGLSILEFLSEEINKRGKLFKEQGVSSLQSYNEISTEKLPRYLLIIDEFQVLLSGNSKISSQAAKYLEDISRRARAFGINMILSTQSLGDVEITQSTLSQIGVRIGMKMSSEIDCTRILNFNNDAPLKFDRAGQAVYNDKNGLPEGNIFFQGSFKSKDRINEKIHALIELKNDVQTEFEGFTKFIIEGNQKGDISKNKTLINNLNNNDFVTDDRFCEVFVGEPSFLQEEHLKFKLRSQESSNVFIIGDMPEAAVNLMNNSIFQIVKQSSPGSKFYLFNLFDVDSEYYEELDQLEKMFDNIKIFKKEKNDLEQVIDEISIELNQRIEKDKSKGRLVLGFLNAQRSRLLQDRGDYGDLSEISKKLAKIIKDGPDYKIHTIIHVLKNKNIEDIFDRIIIKEFENILVLRGGDPNMFVDGYSMEEIKNKNTAYLICPGTKYDADLFKVYDKKIQDINI